MTEALTRYARVLGLVVLALVTLYGAHEFATSDMDTALEYWRGKLWLFPIVLVLSALDLVLEAAGWIWICSRFGVRAFDRAGIVVSAAGKAGMLLPAQLGRVIRPDAMARLGRAPLEKCLKIEGVTLVLDTTSVGSLLVGLAVAQIHPLLGIAATLTVITLALALGDRIANLLSDTRLELPRGFWLRWQTFGIVGVEMSGWVVHGVALWLLIRDLPGTATLGASIFFGSASAVMGVGTGLPGGVGAIEGFLGASLTWMHIPAEHLAFAVGGFRLATFWLWVPVGWLALLLIRRWTHAEAGQAPDPSVTQALGTSEAAPESRVSTGRG